MNSMLSAPESPRGARVLDSLADALMKLFSDLLASSAHVDTDTILTTVTSTIAEQIPVTCIAILMKSDPDMSRVVTADRVHPEIAEYIDDYIATLTRPREAPTAGFSQRVIEAGAPLPGSSDPWRPRCVRAADGIRDSHVGGIAGGPAVR